MKILILGGTLFLGRHVVEAALERGHDITLFNRGKTDPDAYPAVEKLRGDRDGSLSALEGRSWDAVIDPGGYHPRIVRQSAELLARNVGQYVFISSISVYADVAPNGDESRPLAMIEGEIPAELEMKYYGALKALCEQTAEEYFPGKTLNVRAGFIIGKYDRINRFPYWARRLAEGGEVLAPGSPDAPVQVIDARDIAEWVVRQIEDGTTGNFNVTGEPMRFEEFLHHVKAGVGSDATFTWVDDDFLAAQEVRPLDEIVYWLPPDLHGYMLWNTERAMATGLTLRPLADTARETWAWMQANPDVSIGNGGAARLQSGISREREAELLAAWRAKKGDQ